MHLLGESARLGHGASHIGRASGGHQQHQGHFSALVGRQRSLAGDAFHHVAVQRGTLAACLQGVVHGSAGLSADDIENGLARERALAARFHARREPERADGIVAEVTVGECSSRRVHDEPRHPGTVAQTALGAAPVGEGAP